MEDEIAQVVIDLFNNLPNSVKPNQNEFTVIAGIVLTENNINPQVISIASGTKCISNAHDKCNGCILSDSHAEVLAKRGLTRYLLKEVLYLLKNPLYSSILEIDSTKSVISYKLKLEYKFHLVISDNPCGDCSIYERNNNEILFTGAKIVNSKNESNKSTELNDLTEDIIREDVQTLGILRTKSGKSTINLKDRSTSMSCSDKICRWIYLGLLGSIVDHIIQPIYLSTIIVLKDQLSINNSQLNALNRSLIDRMKCFDSLNSNNNQSIECYVCNIVTNLPTKCNREYEYQQIIKDTSIIVNKSISSGININWIANIGTHKQTQSKTQASIHNPTHEPTNMKIIIDEIEILQKRNKLLFNGSLEVTLANTGCLQGSIKRSLGTAVTSSRLCRKQTAELFSQIILLINQNNYNNNSNNSNNSNNEMINNINNQTYYYWKELNINYQLKLQTFLSIKPFNDWICDNKQQFMSFSMIKSIEIIEKNENNSNNKKIINENNNNSNNNNENQIKRIKLNNKNK